MPVTISGTTGITGPDGSASTPSLAGADTNTGMFFPAADTVAIATGGTERARVDSSGNVGIGTSSPQTRLDVVNGDSSNYDVTVSGGRSSSYTGSILFKNSYWSAGAYGAAAIRGLDSGSSGGLLAFYTTTNGGGTTGVPTERARIDSSGNLLFNKTSTAASGSGVAFETNDTTSFYRGGDGSAIRFFRSSTQVGRIDVTGTATSYVTSSDYRLKEDIQPMTGALARVAALKPCTYKWKSTGEESQGFIAHELAEVCPDAVSGEKDAVDEDGNIKPQGIDTSFLVATLTAAIQEQQALITSLTARIAALEGAK